MGVDDKILEWMFVTVFREDKVTRGHLYASRGGLLNTVKWVVGLLVSRKIFRNRQSSLVPEDVHDAER